MPDAPRDSFLGRTLQNLRRLWRDAQPAGWRRGERPLAPDLPDADRERLRGRIDACLSARGGEVSARRRAAVELGMCRCSSGCSIDCASKRSRGNGR